MPEYDRSIFNPPAPVAYVTLENPENNLKIENVPMQVFVTILEKDSELENSTFVRFEQWRFCCA